jgi:hypothetical protein
MDVIHVRRKTVKKSLIAAVLAMLAQPCARRWYLADVSVYDRLENRTLPVYYHQGRYYVAGRPGNEYQINVRNNQGAEILTVVSVDGVNAVSGETANWNQGGYVLGAHSGFNIRAGARACNASRPFFSRKSIMSYAARTGRPDNVGVIG